MNKTKTIVIIGLMVAMSVGLSYIKIMGSIALDQIPAYLTLFIFKDKKAAIVSFFGHIVTSALSGFPFSLPCHLLIATGMFLMFYTAIPILKRTNKYVTCVYLSLVNSYVLTLIVFLFMPFDRTQYLTISSMLLLASLVNSVCALVLDKYLSKAIGNTLDV